MPKVWLVWSEDPEQVKVQTTRPSDIECSVQVEMNNSLYRQIKAAETKYFKFQDAMKSWFAEIEAGRLKRLSNG